MVFIPGAHTLIGVAAIAVLTQTLYLLNVDVPALAHGIHVSLQNSGEASLSVSLVVSMTLLYSVLIAANLLLFGLRRVGWMYLLYLKRRSS
jgi:hypothetical protein